MVGAPPQGEDGQSAATPPSPQDKSVDPAHPHPAAAGEGGHVKAGKLGLVIGAIGVVFGDIGTSPLYAMREALAHSRSGGTAELAVLGTVSLVFWALILVVTVKYVFFLMRADNKGEGGTLALMALAQRAIGKRSTLVFFLGVCGAAMFYADGVLTPAVSVLSAVEGLGDAPGVAGRMSPFILPITIGILITLFMVQARGTASMARAFGPITTVWFLVLASLGAFHIFDAPSILRAMSPHYGALFLIDNGILGFILLGSVFLAVTGAEALYTDMGHFGKAPIRAGWLWFVLPCLMLNYFGQGALVLSDPSARINPFWEMIPHGVYWPVLILATMSTVIASQAVITGAFSLTQQAVQLGLLPRIKILQTSESQAGQIFVPSVNLAMLVGVMLLLMLFPTSSQLAGAYGVAVTGAMLVDSLLAWFIVRRLWKWSLPLSLMAITPFLIIDLAFFGSNLLKIPQGAWAPLAMGARHPDPDRQDAQGQPAADRPDRDAEGTSAAPGLGHGHLPDLGRGHRPRRPDAQSQAQQGAAREEHHPDGAHPGPPARLGGRPRAHRADLRRLQETGHLLRLHGTTQCAQGAQPVPQAPGAEVRHHVDQLLPRPALGHRLGVTRHAPVAGSSVYLPDAKRRQPDRLLPHPARPGG